MKKYQSIIFLIFLIAVAVLAFIAFANWSLLGNNAIKFLLFFGIIGAVYTVVERLKSK